MSQFETGQTDLKADGSGRSYLHDITDEITVFKRQFLIKSSSLSGVKSFGDINDAYVRGLNAQYARMPSVSLNTNSTQNDIFAAHRLVNPAIQYVPPANVGNSKYKESKIYFSQNGFISR